MVGDPATDLSQYRHSPRLPADPQQRAVSPPRRREAADARRFPPLVPGSTDAASCDSEPAGCVRRFHHPAPIAQSARRIRPTRPFSPRRAACSLSGLARTPNAAGGVARAPHRHFAQCFWSCSRTHPSTAANWTPLTTLPEARFGAAAAGQSGRLYVVGGFTTQISSAVVAWDGTVWASTNPMSVERLMPSAAAARGSVFALGGFDVFGLPLNSVERFDPAPGTWSGVAAMPLPRAAFAAGAVGDSLYVAGGQGEDDMPMADAFRFDPIANAWTPVAPLPTPRTGVAGAVLDRRLWVIGGTDVAPSAVVEALRSAERLVELGGALARAPVVSGRRYARRSRVGGRRNGQLLPAQRSRVQRRIGWRVAVRGQLAGAARARRSRRARELSRGGRAAWMGRVSRARSRSPSARRLSILRLLRRPRRRVIRWSPR